MSTLVQVVVGGQYGSEAKGHVTAQLITEAFVEADLDPQTDVEVINIRVAGPNAGHTAYDSNGRRYAFRSLPIGAVINDRTVLYISPGSEVDLAVLYNEIREAEDGGHPIKGRLYMSRQATLIEDRHKEGEAAASLVERVGSTGKGIGAARADRIMRTAMTVGEAFTWGEDGNADVQPWAWAEPEDLYAHDRFSHTKNQHIIIEGTQGYGLSMRASGHYPQVTSSDCRSIDFLAMAGIDPTRHEVIVVNWVVARVYPIRVAGNSGPMKGETTWEALGLPEERTTVTQKVRRVGLWDEDLVARAVQANGGHQANLVITMMDQVIPELSEVTDEDKAAVAAGGKLEAFDKAIDWIIEHTENIGAPVAAFTYSPTDILWTQHAGRQVERPNGILDSIQSIIDSINVEDED